jgi:hypothetical protein
MLAGRGLRITAPGQQLSCPGLLSDQMALGCFRTTFGFRSAPCVLAEVTARGILELLVAGVEHQAPREIPVPFFGSIVHHSVCWWVPPQSASKRPARRRRHSPARSRSVLPACAHRPHILAMSLQEASSASATEDKREMRMRTRRPEFVCTDSINNPIAGPACPSCKDAPPKMHQARVPFLQAASPGRAMHAQ